MKIKVFTLAVTAIAIGVVAAQPSMAQEKTPPMEGAARFHFPVNKWQMESARKPGSRYAIPQNQYAVAKGSMPTKNMLGLDPTVFNQPKSLPPMSAPSHSFGVPVATPTMMAAAPQVMAPPRGLQAQQAPAFNPAFGKQREETPMVANAPQALPPVAAQSHESVSGKLTPGRHRGSGNHHGRSAGVRGKLMTPVNATPQVAVAKELPIASYSKPAFGGGDWTLNRNHSVSATADVSGKVIRQK